MVFLRFRGNVLLFQVSRNLNNGWGWRWWWGWLWRWSQKNQAVFMPHFNRQLVVTWCFAIPGKKQGGDFFIGHVTSCHLLFNSQFHQRVESNIITLQYIYVYIYIDSVILNINWVWTCILNVNEHEYVQPATSVSCWALASTMCMPLWKRNLL